MLKLAGGALPPLETLFSPVAAYPAIGLAVSGGADSLGLMVLAHRWARGLGTSPRLVVYTVDHALRPEAADEAAMVAREAQKLGHAARVLRWDGEKPASGVQAAARSARYRLIGQAMSEDHVPVLLTAHHLADQAETVLMRMAHGSGIDGLAGMRVEASVEGIRIFRPLLAVDPAILRRLVSEAGLTPVEDPSNADPHYERVRWRQAQPMLADLGLTAERIAALSRRAADIADALHASTATAMASVVERDGALTLGAAHFTALPRAIGIRLLSRLLDRAGGGKPYDLAPVEMLADALAGGLPVPRRTLHGAMIASDGITITIAREPARRARPGNPTPS